MYTNLLAEFMARFGEASFSQTDLGKLYRAIPFDQLAALVPATKREQSGKGRSAWLTTKGGIALMILKHYHGLSDALLIERLNTDWAMQRFCDIHLKAGVRIRDDDLPGRWRRRLSSYLDIDKWQVHLAAHWKDDLHHPHLGMVDATCYESFITYPTDVKLIWKCCTQAFTFLNQLLREAGLRKSRVNHLKQKAAYLSFARLRKKSHRKNKKICRSLLQYLHRLVGRITALRQKHPSLRLKNSQEGYLRTIEEVKQQQWRHYMEGEARVPGRMVSLHKPYLRAIIRGKETKPVEFGCKVNKVWVDGICFIEFLSFEAFNEGTRLKSSIQLQQRYTGKCSQMAADAIYATNENRRYCTENGIATCFVPKGKQGREGEQKAAMRSALGTLRGTRLEGSFGREKLHYLLDKVKARTQATEVGWIFFGLLCANAVTIAKRRSGSKERKKAA
ncbi:transposase [Paraflavisolibacter sp. H34]|uniref:transposase n=1 Tax=Huijunlia imazamoxiresistens TaxID=3127457 RepID=UPI0030176E0C